MTWRFISIAIVLSFVVAARAETFTISDRDHVSDAALLDGEFADWNFGGGPLLEVGYMGGIYAEHHAASVIRFDLSKSPITKVKNAKLRLYRPRDFVQMHGLQVDVWGATSAWSAGSGFAASQNGAVTWNTRPEYRSQPIEGQTVELKMRSWIEYDLPDDLVQRWIDHPESNNGLYLTVNRPEKEWGDHVYFNSSESPSGNGPQLVVEGEGSAVNSIAQALTTKPPNDKDIQAWLKMDGRLAQFANDCHMTDVQARVFHYFDISVRDDLIVARYQAPLEKIFDELDQLIQKNDESAVRAKLLEVRRTLLVWEYIRETSWYTSGPLADVLSPKQLATLFSQSVFGAMEQRDEKIEKGRLIRQAKDASNVPRLWEPIPADRMEAHIAAKLQELKSRLELSDQQLADITPGIREDERLENEYVGNFRADLDHVRDLLKAGHDDDQMLDAVRQMHRDHEMFLYYQSIYDTPRWNLLLAKAPVIPFAKWIVHSRKKSDREAAETEEREDTRAYNATTQTK